MTPAAMPTRRLTVLLLSAAVLACASAACVVWEDGAGPNAEPMPLAEALARCDRGEAVLVDVRSRQSYDAGHIPDSVSVPFEEIVSDWTRVRALGKLPVLYCG